MISSAEISVDSIDSIDPVDSIISVEVIAIYIEVSVDVDVVTTAPAIIDRPTSVKTVIIIVAQGNAQCCRPHCRSGHACRCTVVNLLLTRGGVVRLTSRRQSKCDHWGQQSL